MQHHPDRNPGDHTAEEKFKEATEAYEVLKDAERRARYDQFGHDGAAAGFPAAGAAWAARPATRASTWPTRCAPSCATSAAGAAASRTCSAARARGPRPRAGPAGAPQAHARGDRDRGREDDPGQAQGRLRDVLRHAARKGRQSTCAQCDGRGQVRQVQPSMFGQFVNIGPCGRCHGSGTIIEKPCLKCRGEGRLVDASTVTVDVPAGVAEGNYIPLRGLGDAGPRGGPAGDLQVHIEEKEHEVFERDGDDLHVEVPVGMSHGRARRQDRGADARRARRATTCPPGTQSGKSCGWPGKGLPRLRGRGKGDLHVHLRVWTPSKLSARGKQLFEELSKLEEGQTPKPGKSLFDRVKGAFGG